MATIKYSHAYYKFSAGKVFPTIRRWTPQKEEYYRGLVGSELSIQVEGNDWATPVLLVAVTKTHTRDLAPEFLAYDTLTLDGGRYPLPSMDCLILWQMWLDPAVRKLVKATPDKAERV